MQIFDCFQFSLPDNVVRSFWRLVAAGLCCYGCRLLGPRELLDSKPQGPSLLEIWPHALVWVGNKLQSKEQGQV